jgi:hypothetical protein
MSKQQFEQLNTLPMYVKLAKNFSAALQADARNMFATCRSKTRPDAAVTIQKPEQIASKDWPAVRPKIAADVCVLNARPA